jgi:hypothetical protein
MIEVGLLLRGAELLATGGRPGRELTPAAVQAIAIASEGITRVAAETYLAAQELNAIVEVARIRAAERVGRTRAAAPVLMHRLDQVAEQHGRLLGQVFELQRRGSASDAVHLAQLERILAHQTDSVTKTLSILMAL